MATGATQRASSELIIDSPGSPSIRIPLETDRYTIGRSSTNDLPFPNDQSLSREHLTFERTPEGWTIRDLASRNGTQVNGTRLFDAVPLAHGDRISAGHLSIRYDTQGEFKDAKLHEVQFVDQPTGEAVPAGTVTADLHSALQMSLQLGALVRAGRELAGHCPLDELFPLILNLTVDAVKASRGAVITIEAGGEVKTRAIRGEGLRISTAVRDRVIEQRKSLLVPDTSVDLDFAARQSILAQEIRSFMAVPLQTDEQVIGFIYLDSPRLLLEFTVKELNLVTVMANIAAIRIEHARLIEAEKARLLLAGELERAAEIQRRLLPAKPPDIAGLDLAGYNAPCRTVGGDYYDFLPYPDGRIALLIGDVSGKGMGAALLMSSLQARSRVVFETPGDLSAQVSHLNRITAANCPGNCFITFCAVVLDPKSGELRYCNAGHNSPLLLHASGEFESLESTGLVLGLFPNASFEQKACRLAPDDVLLLFSDGVTEACRPDIDEEFGEERLVGLVRDQQGQSASAILDAIKSEITSFTGGAAAADDVTLVVARRG
ncbi:MAG TPA: SpoIIE family protein phosphatase [Bryobacteraceae bacterium]